MVSILILVLLFVGVIGVTLTILGGILLFKKMRYDATATAVVTEVKCQDSTGKCNITLKFKDQSDNEITGNAIVIDKPTKDSTRKIMYDSANPSAFYPSVPPVRAIGAGLFFGGLLIIFVCIGIGIFRYIRTRPSPSPPEQLSNTSEREFAPQESSWFSPRSSPTEVPPPSSADTKSPSPSPSPGPDTASIQAKQYADQMVQKVAEPARKSPSLF